MKKRLIPAILDTAFVFIATFAIVFTLIRFYSFFWLALVVAIIFAFACAIIFRLISARRCAKYSLKTADADKMERTLNTFCLMTEEELISFFITLLDKMEVPYTVNKKGLTLTSNNTCIKFYFTFSKAYEGKIIEFYKNTDEGKNLMVIGRDFSEDVIGLTQRFAGRIKLLDGATLYLTLKRFEVFPKEKLEFKKVKPTLNVPKSLFNKKNAKRYFFYGLLLQFFSFFVYYPVYYVCFGAGMMIFSVICFFFGLQDLPKSNNPFKE